MHMRFWGTRGSLPKPGPTTLRYGGNTSCVEVRTAGGTLIVLDCGSGAHGLGQALLAEASGPLHGHLLISHTHWDHIQGFPFFAPLFVPGHVWDIYGPGGLGGRLEETLAGQMEYAYFPITLGQLGATVRYHDLVEGTFTLDDVCITTRYLSHPALTLGYRLEGDGVVLVYATDHEPHARPQPDQPGETPVGALPVHHEDRGHIEFLSGADLIIHDAQYTAAEYAQKIGWGHSPVTYVVDAALAARGKRLALFHHDPARGDAELDQVLGMCRERAAAAQSPLDIIAAAEGQLIELSADAVAPATVGLLTPPVLVGEASRAAGTLGTVLIVDDEPDVVGLLMASLRPEGFRLLSAGDGETALALARAERPALILLDWMMPGRTGLEVCRALRAEADLQLRQVPVVLLTSRAEGEDIAAGFAAGATDYLTKPFRPSYVRSRVRSWLLRSRGEPAPAHTTRPEGLTGEEDAMASEHMEQPGTDAARIDRDRAQDAAVGTGEEPRVLPRPPAAPRLSPALSATLNTALDRLLEVLGVDGGAVRLLEEETRELVLVAQRGFPPQMAQDTHRRKVGEGLSGLALQQGAPIVVEHLSQHPTLADSRLRREGYESYMVVPLQLHGQLVGTLGLFARSARGFDTYERSFFHQVGVTIENALLYEEAARREQEAAFLDRATQLFNSTLDLDVVLQQVARLVTEVLGDSCTINLIEAGNAYLIPAASYHPDPQSREARLRAQREHPIRIGDAGSVAGLAAVDGHPYLVKDARQEGRVRNVDRLNIHSLITVPIIVKGRILGVLATSITHSGRQFTPADLALALADRAALAIENSRLYAQERRLRQELEGLNQEVQEANRLKTEFVTVVTHELRSPLTSIAGYIELLLEEEGREEAETQGEYLQIVKRNADRLLELINDLLDIARLEAGKLELKRLPLGLEGLIREVSGALRPQIEGKGQHLRLDLAERLPVVTGDPERVTQILLNLVSNAHKYTPQGGSITVATRAESAGVCIAVQDTGIGLSSEEQQKLFTKFFRAQHALVREAGGTGLGLAITRALVELHGGTITVVSAPEQGSTFSVTLPAAHDLTG